MHYTFKVYCSFDIQHTFAENEVQIDPDGDGENDFEPTEEALAALAEELAECLFNRCGPVNLKAVADSLTFIGADSC